MKRERYVAIIVFIIVLILCLYACGQAPATHQHSYGDWTTVTAATCDTSGQEKRVCSCGAEEKKDIPALGHDFSAKFTTDIEATCISKGSKSKRCSRCGEKSEITDVPALGHTFSAEFTIDVAATCTGKGSKSKHCSRCGEKSEVTEIEPLGHNYVDSKCTRCGDEIIAEIDGLTFAYDASSQTYSVKSYFGKETELTIPNSYNNGKDGLRPVTGIGDYAFYKCSSLLKLTIPDGVTKIGYNAFLGCSRFTTITIPDSVTNISENAFTGCDSLQYNTANGIKYLGNEKNPYAWLIKAADNNIGSCDINSNTKYVLGKAFDGCSSIKNVFIPESVIRIGEGAFSGCVNIENATISALAVNYIPKNKLKTVVITSGTKITEGAFADSAMLTSVTIPKTVKEIENNAFENSGRLTDIYYDGDVVGWCGIIGLNNLALSPHTLHIGGYKVEGVWEIPDDVTSIADYAFWNCSGLTSVKVGKDVTRIGKQAFYKCKGLTSITLLEKLTSIGAEAFYECASLTGIKLGTGVTNIDEGAFSGCSALSSVVIPDSVTSLGNYAFENCTNLKSIAVGIGVVNVDNSVFFGCPNIESATITTTLINRFSKSKLKTVVIIGGDYVGNRAFSDCVSLTNVTINKSVTGIGAYAFSNCKNIEVYYTGNVADWCGISGLKNIMMNASVLYVGEDKVRVEKELALPEGVISVSDYAFYGCNGLTSITMPDSVKRIGNSAFENCSSLVSVTLSKNLTGIGDNAFFGCCNIETATLPSSMISCIQKNELKTVVITSGNRIAPGAFMYCQSLTNVIIADSVTSIGVDAFLGCENVETVTLPSFAISYIPKNKLKTVVITSGETIEEAAFSDSSELMSVTLPESVKTIGENAFSNCDNLANIYYTGNVADWCEIIGLNYVMKSSRTLYIGGEKLEGKLVIPNGVKSIGASAFVGCSGITYIIIPDSVTSIGEDAFLGCDKVIYNIYNNAKYLGNNRNPYMVLAKASNTDIVSCKINEQTRYILNDAFRGCFSLEQITIPDNVKSIGENAFSDCRKIETATLPSFAISYIPKDALKTVVVASGAEIEDRAFEDSVLLTSVSISDGVVKIGEYAFSGCGKLEELNLSKTVITIGDYAFSGCVALKSITIPTNVTNIGYRLFNDCVGLTDVTISDGVTDVGEDLFFGCINIENATLPTTVIDYIPKNKLKTVVITSGDSIRNRAFFGSASLLCVTISDSVKSIGDDAFANCNKLTDIRYSGSIASWCGISGLNNIMSSSRTLYIGNKELEGKLIISDGIKSIGASAFVGCSKITSVTIPDSVTSIGESAFFGCNSIETITIPSFAISYIPKDALKTIVITSGKNIGESAFGDCGKLTKVTIPESVRTVGDNAFANCDKLIDIRYSGSIASWCGISGLNNIMSSSRTLYIGNKELEGKLIISDGIKSIGASAFVGCSKITSVSIPDSVKVIGENAFSGCIKIETATIPSFAIGYIPKDALKTVVITSGENIESRAFSDFALLKSVTIPDSIMVIMDYAFENCTSLTDIAIPDSVMSIGYRAFENCKSLGSIMIPNGVISIGDYAFENCTSLTSVTIVADVANMGDDVFKGCDNVEVATLPASAIKYVSKNKLRTVVITGGKRIEDRAFAACATLENITIPNGVTSIGAYSFYNCVKLTEIAIPNSVTSIGKYAFYNCSGLTSIVLLYGLTSIGDFAFYNCNQLANVILPYGVTTIGESVFSGCAALARITIPHSVKNIGENAFSNCSGLTEITMSNSVTRISDSAFYNCGSLTEIKFNGTCEEWQGVEKADNWDGYTGDYIVYCSDGTVSKDGTVTKA